MYKIDKQQRPNIAQGTIFNKNEKLYICMYNS